MIKILNISAYITFLYKDFMVFTEGELKKLNLNFGQLPFILYIGKHPRCTPSDIKTSLKLDWGHCQRSLVRLEGDGFIKREVNSSKKRGSVLVLTDSGQKAFSTGHEVFSSWDQEVSKKLSPEEFKVLKTTLGKLVSVDIGK